MGRAVGTEFRGVYALIVMREGRPLLERYYHGAAADQPFQTHSVTKSVLSMLVGIALAENELPGIDATLGELLDVPEGADPRVRGITLRQLLTMTAGWPDRQVRGRNVVTALLRRPLERSPGTGWEYDSGSSHLVSALLASATGRPASAYAAEKLFEPLGIQPLEWPADPQGVTSGGAGLVLRARELALLGDLYRRDGRWRGRQLVPAEWVRESTRPAERTGDVLFDSYGFHWWVDRATGAYAARGFGGQLIAVVPRERAVIVVGADPAVRTNMARLLNELVLPALHG
jgi:CubicO group peptidase (beta-lactamase class C family)